MSPVRVTWARTAAQLFKARSSALLTSVLLCVSSTFFLFRFESPEGGMLPLPALWALSLSPLLPAFAAFISMDAWSGERRTGRIDLLLAAAVRERDFVIGKLLGAWTFLVFGIVLSLAGLILALWLFAPAAFSGVAPLGFVPAFVVLALQGVLWCAISCAISAFFRNAAAALCVALLALTALPRGVWALLVSWSPQWRSLFSEMPLDVHALDFASGAFSTGTLLVYVIAVLLAVFVNSKAVAVLRLTGRGGAAFRASSLVAVALSAILSVLAAVLALRLDVKFNLPAGRSGIAFSERTRRVLSESDGEIAITAFLPRSDARFRPVGHFLRTLKREAESLGGVRLELRFVDPRWDLAAAERLVRRGVSRHAVVFEKGRRMTTVPAEEGNSERSCSLALQRVATPPVRRNVYWTVGHGESSRADYSPFGMSDIARELVREGYVNNDLDFASGVSVPADCAVLVVAGAKDDFSRLEIGLVESYLRQGGRLLVLASAAERGGVMSILPAWGMRSMSAAMPNARTLSGSDVIVSDFSGREFARSLKGSRIVLDKPVAFVPSAVADAGVGKIDFVPVASVDGTAVAALVERGAGAGSDIAIRPTRIAAIGDSSFVMNGMLSARANANRDFFLNCVSYLSGSENFGFGGGESGLPAVGMDRGTRMRFLLCGSLALPLAVFLLMLLFNSRKARRR